MSNDLYDVNNTLVQLVMVLKSQQLKKGLFPSLRYDDLEYYLNFKLWKDSCPESLHIACDQVLSVSESDIIRFLSRRAIVEGRREKLTDFQDLIEGN